METFLCDILKVTAMPLNNNDNGADLSSADSMLITPTG